MAKVEDFVGRKKKIQARKKRMARKVKWSVSTADHVSTGSTGGHFWQRLEKGEK